MSRIARLRRLGASAGAAITLSLVATLVAPALPAAAVPPEMPTELSVSQPDSTTTILSWEHVPNATRYAVTVNGTTTSTVNNTLVPTQALPEGTLPWSVTAYTGSEAGPTASSTFSSARLAAPTLVSPAPNTILAQPDNAPLLSWAPSAGATSYRVEVDGDSDFIGAQIYTTKSTSYVVPVSLGEGDWFWRVTASKGTNLNSPPSEERRFVVSALAAPTITSPKDDATQNLQDVVLDWSPVPGAASYDVQVSKEADFSQGSALIDSQTGIRGTRYSPSVTYDNASYFWRVRAVDMSGQATPWTASRYSFSRNWPQRPNAVYPALEGAEDVPAPLYFQWTPVPHASEYEIQVGTQPNFTVGTFESCRTAGTTYTPGMFAINTTGVLSRPRTNEDCKPQAGTINYWRVRALDTPFTKSGDIPGVQGLFSEAQAFRYMPLSVTGMSPAGGETVDVPTLRWDTTTGAETYEIQIQTATGARVISAETSATSYTPSGTNRLDPDDGPFTWQITAVGADRSRSVTYSRQFRVSGNVPTGAAAPLTPLSPTPSTQDITSTPELRWEPMPGAHHYTVNVGHAADVSQVWFGHGSGDLFKMPVPYPSMTDTSTRLLLPGTYDWQVTAYDEDNQPLGTGPEGRFKVADIVGVSGHALAQDGQQLDGNHTGPQDPCTASSGECTVPSTPVLKWTPDPRASYYMVYVATDPSFTNLLEPSNAVPATTSSMYAPALDNRAHTYADNQAGQSYYWHIRPCRTAFNCGPDPVSQTDVAQGSFKKRSPQVQGLSWTSGTGASQDGPDARATGNEITFSWTDYWETNQEQPWDQTDELPNQSAKQYRIEVDDDASFSGRLIDSQLVDQTTYTAIDRLYPEGTLYWRVQAVDSDDNGLAWSDADPSTPEHDPHVVVKTTPPAPLTSPVADAQVSGTTPFRWVPQAFTRSYDVEVFANNDTTFSSANRIASATGLRNAAYVPIDTLPASPDAYLWRVRRTDAHNNTGAWSAAGRFRISAGAVNLLSPAPGGSTSPNAALLQWDRVQGAATYEVTLTSPAGGQQSSTTSATAFAPTTNLVTGTYQWRVTARDASGNPIGAASSTFAVDAQLAATLRPVIETPEGTGIGKTLSLTPPSWSPSGVSVTTTYQWLRDGTVISGATNDTYQLAQADFGKLISVRATGTAPGYLRGQSTSLPISPTSGDSVSNLTPPSITGTPYVGQRLTGNQGTWETGITLTYTYEWLRNGSAIPGETSRYYTLTEADAATEISFKVTASATGRSAGVRASNPVLVETLREQAPVQLTAPSGTGVGSTGVAVPPVWNQPDVQTTYQWTRDGNTIPGATSTTYTFTATDLDRTIRVRAIGRKSGFKDAASESGPVVVTAGAGLANTGVPAITGTARPGQTLATTGGSWNQARPTLSYQWMRNGAPIAGATRSSYRLTAADAATSVTVQVTAAVRGYASASASSAAVKVRKNASTTTSRLSATRIKPGKRAKLTITVTVPGVSAPTGKLVIKVGKKTVKTLTLKSRKKGTVTFKLPKLKAKKHKIKVIYKGNATTARSKAKVAVLTVAR